MRAIAIREAEAPPAACATHRYTVRQVINKMIQHPLCAVANISSALIGDWEQLLEAYFPGTR